MTLESLALDAPAPAAARLPHAWAALDAPGEWRRFSRPLPGGAGAWESWLALEGMDCPGCALDVEEAIGRCDGVSAVQVNGSTATARVVWSPAQGRPSAWWDALQRAGYGALPAGDLLGAAPRERARRLLLWRWLVAGFCMMQVMMYAWPAYVAAPGEITPDVQALLRWASWLLTLPVMLFSCLPFFRSAWRDARRLRAGMDVPVALGLLIAFAASTAATFDPAGPLGTHVWFDSVTMFVFFLLTGRLLEQRLRDRTSGSLEALGRRLSETVERRGPDGRFTEVPVRTLAAGDIVRVLPGQAFPADGLVLEGRTDVDEALLTGESRPVPRAAAERVVAGSHNLSASVVMVVERCGEDTRFAAIVALMERASVEKPRLAQLADRHAGRFLAAVLLGAAAAAAWWWHAGAEQALGIAIAVLIVTCPCALSLATPAATLAAAGALARRGILVRRLQALEDAAEVDVAVFDKTGTLTAPDMAVAGVRTRPGAQAWQAQAIASSLARHSLHPVSRTLAAASPADDGFAVSDARETPGRGVEALVTLPGQPAERMRLGAGSWCGAAARSGGTQVHLADLRGWLASFELDEILRPDAVTTVVRLRRDGLTLQLLSGDAPAAVARVAGAAGMDEYFAACTPEDKLDHLRALQADGHRVAMIGDGMNDGPVLAAADVSIAMGEGVPLAQAKADVIVGAGPLGAVADFFAQARRTRAVVRQNLAWAAGYNLVCIPLAAAGAMPPWLAGLGMAASSLLVIANSARLARLPA